MDNKKTQLLCLILLNILISLSFFGCGEKNIPLPPTMEGQNIAAPYDLNYTNEEEIITLFWNHRIDLEKAVIKPESFEIFMAKKTIQECKGCPFEFKMLNLVSASVKQYSIKLEKGFKYYFRVRALDDTDMISEYSKTVQFEYK